MLELVREVPWEVRQYDDLWLHARMRLINGAACEYEVRTLIEHQDGLLFQAFDKNGAEFWTKLIEETQPFIKGTIRSDGCSHNNFAEGGYLHACRAQELVRLGPLFERLYEWAATNFKG